MSYSIKYYGGSINTEGVWISEPLPHIDDGFTLVFNADNWAFEVQRGDLFLFPSHLMHQVENNMSGKDRYMVAFNYFLEGEIGEHTGAMKLRCT